MNYKAPKIDIIFMRRFTDTFPDLFEDSNLYIVQNAIDSVYDMFLGIDDIAPTQEKVRQIYGLLTAWYIVDTSPQYCLGMVSTGGGLINSKTIGGVKVQYNVATGFGNKDLLKWLLTNTYGVKAKMLIDTSYRRIGGFVI